MPIPFQCPYCGLQMMVDDQLAGQSGPCRGCGQMVVVPGPQGAPMPSGPPPGIYGIACPRCDSPRIGSGPWPWYLGTIGAIFVSAKLCHQCGHEFDSRKPNADFRQRKRRLALLINGFGGLGIVLVVSALAYLIYRTFNG